MTKDRMEIGEIHSNDNETYLDNLTEEQKKNLGEKTISDEDIIRFGNEEKSDSDRFEILKRTKTPMDIFILMRAYDYIWSGDKDDFEFIHKYIIEECNENMNKILPNIIQAASIHITEFYSSYTHRNLIELYQVIIGALKIKYKLIRQDNQTNFNLATNMSNSNKEVIENGKNVNEKIINDTFETHSRIYLKILDCTKSAFTNACDSRKNKYKSLKGLQEYCEGINNLLRKSARNYYDRTRIENMRPIIKNEYESLISLKEEIERQKLEDTQKSDREYLFRNDNSVNED